MPSLILGLQLLTHCVWEYIVKITSCIDNSKFFFIFGFLLTIILSDTVFVAFQFILYLSICNPNLGLCFKIHIVGGLVSTTSGSLPKLVFCIYLELVQY